LRKNIGSKKLSIYFCISATFRKRYPTKERRQVGERYDAGELLGLKQHVMFFLARLLVRFVQCLLLYWQCYCVVVLLLAVLLAWLWIFMLA